MPEMGNVITYKKASPKIRPKRPNRHLKQSNNQRSWRFD